MLPRGPQLPPFGVIAHFPIKHTSGVISGMLTESSLCLEQETCLPLSGMTLEDKPEGVRTSFRLNYFAREIKEDGIHIYHAYNLG